MLLKVFSGLGAMTADQQEREIHGMLKFMRDWDYIINCQRDMYDPRFMPPFDGDTPRGWRYCHFVSHFFRGKMITFTPEQQLRCLANNVQPILVALVDGYSYDPGDSDLDNEQPISVRMTLGDYRRASALLHEVKKT